MNGVEVVASWFTPAVLFCVLNLMIGTIFYRSTLKPPHTLPQNKDEEPPPPQQPVRVPSFFERVKSFNLSRHQEELHHHETDEELHHHETEEPHHVTRSKSDAVVKAAPAARVVLQKSANVRVSTEKEEEDEERRRPASVRERTVAEDEKADDFINSSSKSDAVVKAAPAARVVLQKSASVRVSTEKEEEDEERRRPATVRERTVAEDEAEDEKADDFINRFRQQLKLQRLDSLLRQRGSGRRDPT